jgi:hypothetical protein
MNGGRFNVARALACAALAAVLGCGSDPPSHPDTGAGAGLPVPTTENCVDLCARLGDCVVTLCNENTNSTQFEGLQGALALQCESTCTDALVMSQINPTAWSCIFQSSCRQVFERDICHTSANYHCM